MIGTTLHIVIILGLLNTTILICFKKWGWLDLYAAYRRVWWMPNADCYLCLGFWLSLLQVLLYGTLSGHWYLLVPFCSAALTNYLTNIAVIHDHGKK